MRITIAHTKGRQQMIQIVDRAFDDVFKGLALGTITVSSQQKSWQGSVMTFSLVAKLGFISNPIRGTVEVTDKDVTLDADIGMLGKLIPAEKIQTALQTRLRGLLS
jgi:Putative polyhydroxyalkanoic acid system protein (PHA_gran_rgn)